MASTLYDFRKILQKYCEDYSGVIELTKEGNVHYHVWFTDGKHHNMKYFYIALKKVNNFGFYCLSRENNNKSKAAQQADCYNYLCKDVHETYQIMQRDEIIINHENIRDDHFKKFMEEEKTQKPLNIKILNNINELDSHYE